ncbi:MAG: hypothetical protein MJ233_03860 [Mycoplasmoidaceae bacterium]|nr:hypothetical protein [Mycoplasmoidaceae bacterium]
MEIDQTSRIGQTILTQGLKIDQYKKEIDKINPAILQNVQTPDLNLHKGVSEVIVSQNKIPAEITKMFKDLNKAKAPTNTNTVSTILFNLKNDSILDQNKKVREDWLESNRDYADLSRFIKDAKLNFDKDKDVEKDLHTKYESLSLKKGEAKIATVATLSKDGQKNVGHHVFVVSVAIAILFFVITVVLLFVRWFAY